jgi:peptide/histidine transporter 3/4
MILKIFLRLNFQGGVDEKVKNGREGCTLDGTLDWHGRPAIRQRTGSWVAATLILGNYFLQ